MNQLSYEFSNRRILKTGFVFSKTLDYIKEAKLSNNQTIPTTQIVSSSKEKNQPSKKTSSGLEISSTIIGIIFLPQLSAK